MCARRFFLQWVGLLKWSRMNPYHEFAKCIETHLDGILAFCDKKVSLVYVEAMNLTIKNILCWAYGFRDKPHMKLKMIQGCTPG
jgi:transposase